MAIKWPRDYVGQLLHLAHYSLAAGPLIWFWRWGWPGSFVVWLMHELTQAQSKEVAECKLTRALLAEGGWTHAELRDEFGLHRTEPLSHWRLFLTFGHRKWFDLSGYLLGGTVVSLLRYFLG
jgi:hypothetical protein